MRKHIILLIITIMLLTGCGRQSDSGLSSQEEAYLEALGLLSKDETVLFFDSSTKFERSGSFFTDQRVASYWLDLHTPAKSQKSSALYRDVANISLRYAADWTYAHDILIELEDGTSFHVYVSSDKDFANNFFKTLTSTWQQAKDP